MFYSFKLKKDEFDETKSISLTTLQSDSVEIIFIAHPGLSSLFRHLYGKQLLEGLGSWILELP